MPSDQSSSSGCGENDARRAEEWIAYQLRIENRLMAKQVADLETDGYTPQFPYFWEPQQERPEAKLKRMGVAD